MRFPIVASLLLVLSTAFAACGEDKPAEPAPPASEDGVAPESGADTAMRDMPVSEASAMEHPATSAEITADDFKERVRILADDRFEGRGPGTEKGEAAADWIAAELARLGVRPGNGESYFQDVPAVAITLDPGQSRLAFTGPDGTTELTYGEHAIWWTKRAANPEESVANSEIVFVGYGVIAPEENWNDYEGIDVKGKTVVIFINDPGFVTRDDTLFKGKAMTYYGRWTYKYEEAARQGAAAAIIVHETEPAAYGWEVVRNSWSGTQLDLDRGDKGMGRVAIEGWITGDVARGLFASAGIDYDEAIRAANTRGFRARPMPGLKLDGTARSTVERMTTRNVIGVVPGTMRPDEYVLYTAHWDHLGMKPGVPGDDKIHNGAVDNGTGVSALLEIAEAFAASPAARSTAFLFVTLEEQGLLGSEYFAENPLMPHRQIVGGINIDAMLPKGPSRDIVVVGSGASQLEDILAGVAAAQDRVLAPDPEPEKGYFYRSDHISLSKRGVPMLYAGGGMELREGGVAAGRALRDDYRANRYHQPSDEYSPDWDVRGPMEDVAALYGVGRQMAEGDGWPEWYEGNEFRATREASRAQ